MEIPDPTLRLSHHLKNAMGPIPSCEKINMSLSSDSLSSQTNDNATPIEDVSPKNVSYKLKVKNKKNQFDPTQNSIERFRPPTLHYSTIRDIQQEDAKGIFTNLIKTFNKEQGTLLTTGNMVVREEEHEDEESKHNTDSIVDEYDEIVDIKKKEREGYKIFFKFFQRENCDKTIILVHGACSGIYSMDPLFKLFCNRYNCLVFDWIGVGRSDIPDLSVDYEAEEITNDLEKVVKEFASKNTTLIGHSYGTSIIMKYMYKYYMNQEEYFYFNINEIILMGTGTIFLKNSLYKMTIYSPVWLLQCMIPLIKKNYKKTVFHKKALKDSSKEEIIQDFVEEYSKNDMYMFKSIMKNIDWPNDKEISILGTPVQIKDKSCDKNENTEEKIQLYEDLIINGKSHRDIKIRTLIMQGDDDKVFPKEYALKLKERITGSEYLEMKDAGHFFCLSKAKETFENIEIFLKANERKEEKEIIEENVVKEVVQVLEKLEEDDSEEMVVIE